MSSRQRLLRGRRGRGEERRGEEGRGGKRRRGEVRREEEGGERRGKVQALTLKKVEKARQMWRNKNNITAAICGPGECNIIPNK